MNQLILLEEGLPAQIQFLFLNQIWWWNQVSNLFYIKIVIIKQCLQMLTILEKQSMVSIENSFQNMNVNGVFVFPGPQPFAQPLALALAPSPVPQFVFVGPGPQYVFTGPGPQLYLPVLAPNLHLPALAPNLYLPALAYNFISSPGPEFAYTNLVSSICVCIYGSGLRLVLTVRGLNSHLPYYWQQQQWQQ